MRTGTLDVTLRTLNRSADWLAALVRKLMAMLAVARERNLLLELDDRALKDIGLNRAVAEQEARRPPWELPPGRH